MITAFLIFWRYFGRPFRKTPWSDGDAASLSSYLQCPSGMKLVAKFREQEASTNASAVLLKDRNEYGCGFAAGSRAALAWVLSLSVVNAQQAVELSEDRPKGEDELLETLSP